MHARTAPYVQMLSTSDICLNKCCVETYNKLYPCNAVEVCRKTLVNKECWLEERKYSITASRCYIYILVRPMGWKSKEVLFWTTITEWKYQIWKWTRKFAREAYRNYTKNTVVEFGFCVYQSEPWLGVSPDSIVVDENENKPVKLIEIKCPVIGRIP